MISKELLTDIIESLEWMAKDMKWRSDQTKGNLDVGSEGDYSPGLKKAITVLDRLKEEL